MELIKRRRINIYLIIVLFVFAIVQFLVIGYYGEHWYIGDFATMNNDDVKYIRSAWTLLDKHILVYHDVNQPTAFIMPGYPVLIALFMKVFGRVDGLIALKVFQGLLQAASLYLVFRITKEIFNDKTALIAVILNALYLPEMVSAVLILTETVFKFLLVALVYVSIKAIKNKNITYYSIGGMIWGLAILIRPTILLYPIVVFIMWIVFKYSIKEMIGRSLLVLCIGITLLSPWIIRNYIEFSRFIPLTLSSGNPFLQGTYINYDQTKDYTSYEAPSDAIERDKIEMDTGIKRLKENFVKKPFSYIFWYTIGKSYYFWNVPFYYKNVFGIPFFLMHIYHIILLVLALGNIILFRADLRKEKLILLLVILYFNLVYLPYFTCSRYAYPIMSFVIVLAANTFINIVQRYRMDKVAAEYNDRHTSLV